MPQLRSPRATTKTRERVTETERDRERGRGREKERRKKAKKERREERQEGRNWFIELNKTIFKKKKVGGPSWGNRTNLKKLPMAKCTKT